MSSYTQVRYDSVIVSPYSISNSQHIHNKEASPTHYTCTPHTYLYTSNIPVHLIHTCTPHTYLYTSYIPVHLIHTCTPHTYLYTSYIYVHLIHTCTPHTYVYTSYIPVHFIHTCTPQTYLYKSYKCVRTEILSQNQSLYQDPVKKCPYINMLHMKVSYTNRLHKSVLHQ